MDSSACWQPHLCCCAFPVMHSNSLCHHGRIHWLLESTSFQPGQSFLPIRGLKMRFLPYLKKVHGLSHSMEAGSSSGLVVHPMRQSTFKSPHSMTVSGRRFPCLPVSNFRASGYQSTQTSRIPFRQNLRSLMSATTLRAAIEGCLPSRRRSMESGLDFALTVSTVRSGFGLMVTASAIRKTVRGRLSSM